MSDDGGARENTQAISHHTWIASLLSFAAGGIDTIGYVGLYGLFTAHVTGNFVLLGASLAQPRAALVAKLLALPLFIATVAAARKFALHRNRRHQDATFALLVAQLSLMAGFVLVGFVASPIASGDAPLAIAAGLTGVVAMGIQNTLSRTTFSDLSPTTVMTGNVTQLTIDAVDLTSSEVPEERAKALAHFGKMAFPVVSFALGACTGGFAFMIVGFLAALPSMAAVLAVILLYQRAPLMPKGVGLP